MLAEKVLKDDCLLILFAESYLANLFSLHWDIWVAISTFEHTGDLA